MATLNELARAAYDNSANHGFWDDLPESDVERATYYGNKLALIHSEVSEALEELRRNPDPRHLFFREDGKPEGFAIELADVLIRVLDLFGHLGIDPEIPVEVKATFNAGRPVKHGKVF